MNIRGGMVSITFFSPIRWRMKTKGAKTRFVCFVVRIKNVFVGIWVKAYTVAIRNEHATVSFAWNSSHAGKQTHVQCMQVGVVTGNESRHEIVVGLVSQASHLSSVF